MRVLVEPYNLRWSADFLEIRAQLISALKEVQYISIEHVGSTSVPGLAAKPIIDIDIIVARQDIEAAISACKFIGYDYMGEWGIPDRHALRASSLQPPRNLYVCVEGCLALRNHIAVRDILRVDRSLREAYAALKLDLATQEWADENEYCEAKSVMLGKILRQAGIQDQELAEVERVNDRASKVSPDLQSSD